MKMMALETFAYDWSSLFNGDISNKYMLTVRNEFDILQDISEIHTPNDEYENFVTAHMEAAAECIQSKLRAKCGVPWEPLVIRK